MIISSRYKIEEYAKNLLALLGKWYSVSYDKRNQQFYLYKTIVNWWVLYDKIQIARVSFFTNGKTICFSCDDSFVNKMIELVPDIDRDSFCLCSSSELNTISLLDSNTGARWYIKSY